MPYLNGYLRRATITVNHAKCGSGGALANFPFYFAGSAECATTANGGYSLSTGNDVVFSSDPDGQTTLSFKKVLGTYNSTTGAGVWWVNAGSGTSQLTSVSDAVVYVFVGKASVSDGSSTAAFNSNYKLAADYPDGSSLTSPVADMTSGGNNGTVTGATATSGKIDGAAAVSSASHIIDFGSGMTDLTSNWTVSGWFNRDSAAAADRFAIYSRWTNTTTNRQLFCYFNATSDNKIHVDIPFVVALFTSTSTFAPGSGWNHYAVTRSGNNYSLYVNGNTTPEATVTDSSTQETGGNVTVGNWTFNLGGSLVKGAVGGTRTLNAAMSADWVATDYNTGNHGTSAFYSLGAFVYAAPIRPLVVRQAMNRAATY